MVITNLFVNLNRYKLHLNVKDDSGSCKLMMLDTIANVIVGTEAVELWDGSYDEVMLLSRFSILSNSSCSKLSTSTCNRLKTQKLFLSLFETWLGNLFVLV